MQKPSPGGWRDTDTGGRLSAISGQHLGARIMMAQVFVALDTADLASALAQARAMRGAVGGIKLGLEFFAGNGPEGVGAVIAAAAPVFLDLKLHDIPNTVAGAVRALTPLAPFILNVHAAGGEAMMRAARAAAEETAAKAGWPPPP